MINTVEELEALVRDNATKNGKALVDDFAIKSFEINKIDVENNRVVPDFMKNYIIKATDGAEPLTDGKTTAHYYGQCVATISSNDKTLTGGTIEQEDKALDLLVEFIVLSASI